MIHRQFIAVFVATLALTQVAQAQQVETDPSGKQWQVSRYTTKQLVPDSRVEERPYTVYTEHVSTELHPTYRNVYTPVVEYTWEPYMANRWNPFAQPTVAYRYVPHTRWDVHTEETQIPVTRRDMVPVTRTAQVSVVGQKWVDVEHTTKVALSSSDPFSGTATASRPASIGSTGALSSDPPKTTSTWQNTESRGAWK